MFSPDNIFQVVLDALGQRTEANFRKFVNDSAVTKWFIAGDFVIGADDRPNDSFAFTIFPYNAELAHIQAEIDQAGASDLKKVKSVRDRMLNYLRSPKRFTFCFVVNKDRKWFADVEETRRSLDETLVMMRRWQDAGRRTNVIKQFERLREEARANSFNARLLGDMVLTNALAAVVACLLLKHGTTEKIGWFPDRDKMTSAYGAIANEMFSVNVSAICQANQLDESKFQMAIGTPDSSAPAKTGTWYDSLIRIPDHIAGTAAAWNIDINQLPAAQPKFGQIAREVFADNPNILMLRLRIGSTLNCSYVRISRTPLP